jgi:hypothetical protein
MNKGVEEYNIFFGRPAAPSDGGLEGFGPPMEALLPYPPFQAIRNLKFQ